MADISIKHNFGKVQRQLARAGGPGLTRATRNALNDTARDVRTHIVTKTFPTAFKLRNKSFARGVIRFTKASSTNLTASVGDQTPEGREYLKLQETGGTKRPKGGGHIAVPTSAVRRGARGVVKSQRPRKVLGGRGGFKADLNGGSEGIFKKVGKRTRLLFVLVKSARLKPRLPFTKDGERKARQVFPRHFARESERELRKALKR